MFANGGPKVSLGKDAGADGPSSSSESSGQHSSRIDMKLTAAIEHAALAVKEDPSSQLKQGELIFKLSALLSISNRKYPERLREDILQEQLLHVMPKLAEWDPEQGKFLTFALQRLQGAAVDYLRNSCHLKRNSSKRENEVAGTSDFTDSSFTEWGHRPQLLSADFQRPSTAEKGSAPTPGVYLEPSSYEPPAHHREELKDFWKEVLKGLKSEHRLIVLLHFKSGMTLKDIGEQIGHSESSVSLQWTAIRGYLESKLADSKSDLWKTLQDLAPAPTGEDYRARRGRGLKKSFDHVGHGSERPHVPDDEDVYALLASSLSDAASSEEEIVNQEGQAESQSSGYPPNKVADSTDEDATSTSDNVDGGSDADTRETRAWGFDVV